MQVSQQHEAMIKPVPGSRDTPGAAGHIPRAVTPWLSPEVLWYPKDYSCPQSGLWGQRAADSSLML